MPAYYRATFEELLNQSDSEVMGQLTVQNAKVRFQLPPEQIDAWKWQLPILRLCLSSLAATSQSKYWTVLLEYPIPLLGTRIDCVLLCGSLIVVVEFKSGKTGVSGVRQVEDYALSLANYHEYSQDLLILPIVVKRRKSDQLPFPATPCEITGTIFPVRVEDATSFPKAVMHFCEMCCDVVKRTIIGETWDSGRFKPVPPIVEAAVRLYEGKDVFAIDHACSPQESLESATQSIIKVIREAKQSGSQAICFVTGVPGAGKTLVGLNTAHSPNLRDGITFLSGNRPLILVIKEALLRDARKSRRLKKKDAVSEIDAFIHNVHQFAEENYENQKEPIQSVIIFDEAQRAWDRQENLDRFERDKSEPEMLLEIMNRRSDSVIVALVGGGQEINSGEAGIAEWGRALQQYSGWTVYASPEVLAGDSSTAGFSLFENIKPINPVVPIASLHLNTNIRTIRGQFISDWVNAVVDGKFTVASKLAGGSDFKVWITRDLGAARRWLKRMRRGTQTAGLVGSAGGQRLRADGLEYSFPFHKDFKWQQWFLNGEDNANSCNKLEVFATQFEIQGLELDWVGVCWSEDFVFAENVWKFKTFRSTKWNPLKDERKQFYKRNAYRVLLTRARQGMVIYVPSPDLADSTRLHSELDSSYEALLSAGATQLQ